jgi:hypothetical protein
MILKLSFNENISDINEIDYLFVGKFAGNREDLINHLDRNYQFT